MIIVAKEDRNELGGGLIRYISQYWAGFFPALFVEVGREKKAIDTLFDTLSEVFCKVERLAVQDTEEMGGQVFSAVARMLGKMGIGGLNRTETCTTGLMSNLNKCNHQV